MPQRSRTFRVGTEVPSETVPGRSGIPSVAERLIRDRVKSLLNDYKPAVKNPSADDEAVHQLRVTSRRLTAALQTLQPLLPDGPRKKLIRKVKAVRRAAGDARDLDVLRDRVQSGEFPLKRKPRRRILKFLKKRRAAAQQPLRRSFRKRPPRTLRRRADELLTAIAPPGDEFLLHDDACRSELVEAAVSRFSADLPAAFETAADLHRLRICGKRLRYTLEALIELESFPDRAAAERLVDVLKEIQDRLGNINDNAVSRRRLKCWADNVSRRSLRTAFKHMAEYEATQADERTQEFFEWWSDDRQQSFRRRLDELTAGS